MNWSNTISQVILPEDSGKADPLPAFLITLVSWHLVLRWVSTGVVRPGKKFVFSCLVQNNNTEKLLSHNNMAEILQH